MLPEEATIRNPRPNSRYSFRNIPDNSLVSVKLLSSKEDGLRLETRASSPAVNKGQPNLQELLPQIGVVAPEELMPRRKRMHKRRHFSTTNIATRDSENKKYPESPRRVINQ